MSEQKTAAEIKADRIAASRAELARRYAENPEAVRRFEARKAALAAAAKRERQRIDLLVLGGDRPAPVKTTTKVRGKRRSIKTPAPLEAGVDRALKLRETYSPWQGTPETLAHAARTHQGALSQLFANGTIDANQLEWAAEIANVHRSIESDVAIAVASLEARVDQSRGPSHLAGEGIKRVRLHAAYTQWRAALPAPKQLILDMIVGDHVGFTVAAHRHRVHHRKAKRLLLWALDLWPGCVDQAFRTISAEDVRLLNTA